jgi:hypothetical protein
MDSSKLSNNNCIRECMTSAILRHKITGVSFHSLNPVTIHVVRPLRPRYLGFHAVQPILLHALMLLSKQVSIRKMKCLLLITPIIRTRRPASVDVLLDVIE